MAPQHPAQEESPRDPLVCLDIYFRTPTVLVTMVELPKFSPYRTRQGHLRPSPTMLLRKFIVSLK